MAGFSLPLADEDQGAEGTQWAGVSRILGPKWSHLPVITVGLLGFQLFWTVEMSYGQSPFVTLIDDLIGLTALVASPYLLSLGLNKSLMAMVFVAGPLSGLIVQPVIGKFGQAFRIEFASWLSSRYLSRQIEIAFRKAATIHVRWRCIQCRGHVASGIHPKVRFRLCGNWVSAGAWIYSDFCILASTQV
jgi:hypothetical protein